MKKQIFTVAVLMIGMSVSLATNEGGKRGERKKKATKELVIENTEASFITKYTKESHKLKVEITGNLDPNASVSITNQRGSSLLFSIVEKKQKNLEFDLSKLEKGSYNIMFIAKDEIRIKKIVIN